MIKNQVGRPRGDAREKLLASAFACVREKGYAGASSRAIGSHAGVNPALVFYYFDSVDDLLVAALAEASADRLERYRPAISSATSPAALVEALQAIYREDVETGFIRVATELVAAGVTRPELGRAVTELMRPWLALAETGVTAALAGTPLEDVAPARSVAHAAVVFYLGANLLTQLRPGEAGIDDLFARATEVTQLLEGLGLARSADS